MQSDIYVGKDYDKIGHRAIQHSETHVFLFPKILRSCLPTQVIY